MTSALRELKPLSQQQKKYRLRILRLCLSRRATKRGLVLRRSINLPLLIMFSFFSFPPNADGWVDEGALCRKSGSIETVAKRSYGRGAGYPMTCADGLVEDAALCYPPCGKGFYGVGPVCWERCPVAQDYPVDGGAVCCRNKTVCTKKVLDLSAGLPLAVMEAILSGGDPKKVEKSVLDALQSLLGFVMPKCDATDSEDPKLSTKKSR